MVNNVASWLTGAHLLSAAANREATTVVTTIHGPFVLEMVLFYEQVAAHADVIAICREAAPSRTGTWRPATTTTSSIPGLPPVSSTDTTDLDVSARIG